MKKSDKAPDSAPAFASEAILLGRRKIGPSREDMLRMTIPTIEGCPTLYRPVQNFLMILPLPDQGKSEGGIILPDRSRITYSEGHIIAKGPTCVLSGFELGTCVTWPQHQEYKVSIEGYTFVLIGEGVVLMAIPREVLQAQADVLNAKQICALCNAAGGDHKIDCPRYSPVAAAVAALTPSETHQELSDLGHGEQPQP